MTLLLRPLKYASAPAAPMMSSSGCGEMIMMVLPLISRKGLLVSGLGAACCASAAPSRANNKVSLPTIVITISSLPLFRRQRFGDVAPLYQYELLIFHKLLEVAAAHHVEVTLPPCGTPVRMVPCRSSHFLVSVR